MPCTSPFDGNKPTCTGSLLEWIINTQNIPNGSLFRTKRRVAFYLPRLIPPYLLLLRCRGIVSYSQHTEEFRRTSLEVCPCKPYRKFRGILHAPESLKLKNIRVLMELRFSLYMCIFPFLKRTFHMLSVCNVNIFQTHGIFRVIHSIPLKLYFCSGGNFIFQLLVI